MILVVGFPLGFVWKNRHCLHLFELLSHLKSIFYPGVYVSMDAHSLHKHLLRHTLPHTSFRSMKTAALLFFSWKPSIIFCVILNSWSSVLCPDLKPAWCALRSLLGSTHRYSHCFIILCTNLPRQDAREIGL